MSHHIYHTRGFILASQAIGESNRFYKIFTEELGLVGASAQSVREGKSKLRYTLHDLSFVTVDLVRGKEVWRIISAGAWRPLEKIKTDTRKLKLLVQYCSFLSRFIHGERRDTELSNEIKRVADFLEAETIPQNLILSFETMTILRTLVHLGYIDPKGHQRFLGDEGYSLEALSRFERVRQATLPLISNALDASHL
ncbi:MAG: recombination protein O N-terminal domain-containing protein [Candidatus Yonathbacteria bacterium]|nr:recombination protein O N-terminal domain-containing protein [Candidatus Yonathbacteria bacterium]